MDCKKRKQFVLLPSSEINEGKYALFEALKKCEPISVILFDKLLKRIENGK